MQKLILRVLNSFDTSTVADLSFLVEDTQKEYCNTTGTVPFSMRWFVVVRMTKLKFVSAGYSTAKLVVGLYAFVHDLNEFFTS